MLPDYYKATVNTLLRFALLMLSLGLIAGIIYAESAKKVAMGAFDPLVVFQANYNLSLLHGHTLMFGVFIPLSVLALLVTPVLLLGTKPVGAGALSWFKKLYIPGALASVALLLYKAYAVQFMVRGGSSDFANIDHLLFQGNHTLRTIMYAVPHTAYGVALFIVVIAIYRSLKTAK
jgi:hypothetical protein